MFFVLLLLGGGDNMVPVCNEPMYVQTTVPWLLSHWRKFKDVMNLSQVLSVFFSLRFLSRFMDYSNWLSAVFFEHLHAPIFSSHASSLLLHFTSIPPKCEPHSVKTSAVGQRIDSLPPSVKTSYQPHHLSWLWAFVPQSTPLEKLASHWGAISRLATHSVSHLISDQPMMCIAPGKAK